MPLTERIRASRMRDIRTSGLKRGEEAVSLSLPYSTARPPRAVNERVTHRGSDLHRGADIPVCPDPQEFLLSGRQECLPPDCSFKPPFAMRTKRHCTKVAGLIPVRRSPEGWVPRVPSSEPVLGGRGKVRTGSEDGTRGTHRSSIQSDPVSLRQCQRKPLYRGRAVTACHWLRSARWANCQRASSPCRARAGTWECEGSGRRRVNERRSSRDIIETGPRSGSCDHPDENVVKPGLHSRPDARRDRSDE
jgi:hypothetical protein